MELFHPGLKELLQIEDYSQGQKFGFLSIETPIPEFIKKLTTSIPNYKIGLHLRREYRHIAMAFKAWTLKEADTLLVFEIYLQHVFIALPMLALSGKKVLLCLHGDQQFAQSNSVKYLGLIYLKLFLKLFNFKALLFEIDDRVLPESVRLPDDSKIIIPHPLRSDFKPLLSLGERLPIASKVKIGVVGMIRDDKPIFQLVEKLVEYSQKHSDNCELIIGLPIKQKSKKLEDLGVKLYDTTQEENYYQLLQELDILATSFKEDSYYYRVSGVISDAVSCGCFILAPDLPAIKHQISQPAKVGLTYQNFDEIETLVDAAILTVREQGKDAQWLWRETRTAQALAKQLHPSMES